MQHWLQCPFCGYGTTLIIGEFVFVGSGEELVYWNKFDTKMPKAGHDHCIMRDKIGERSEFMYINRYKRMFGDSKALPMQDSRIATYLYGKKTVTI